MAKVHYKSMQDVERILRMYGVPKKHLLAMRNILANDAMSHGDYTCTERFYTALGLALNELYGFQEEELGPIYQRIYDISCEIADDKTTWEERRKELQEKAGIVICFDDDFAETELPTEEENEKSETEN